MMPYMYHCHMLPHEDDGMMGQFVVTCPANTSINPLKDETTFMEIFPNPSGGDFILNTGNNTRKTVRVFNPPGKMIFQFDSSEKIINFSLQEQEAGIYYVQVNGPDKQQTIRVSKF